MLQKSARNIVLSGLVFLLAVGVVWGEKFLPAPALPLKNSVLKQKTKQGKKPKKNAGPKVQDAKNKPTEKKAEPKDPEYSKYGIYQNVSPKPGPATPRETTLPLEVPKNARIAFIGNTLLERSQYFGDFETLLHQRYAEHDLIVRNLCWSADTPDLQPRPANFATTEQHLTHEKADIIIAAYGYNESFEGKAGVEKFRNSLTAHVRDLKSKAFNGKTSPQIVLLSPIANENLEGVAAADLNNANIKLYADVIKNVADTENVGYVDLFTATLEAMRFPGSELTINGAHLNKFGYEVMSAVLYQGLFGEKPLAVNEAIREIVLDKNRQYFRRFRPLNTFYYTGGRSQSYGYLDFLPAMKNFDLLVINREQRIWDLARGKKVDEKIDDSNLPPLPKTTESRGANRWMSAVDEMKSFTIDPRFEVNLFAGEEEFPDIAAPIQMRWDAKGRLWVSCSTTYPHVYPKNEPNDKLVILEDTDGDGKADKSTVFADNLHIPLSFEFGDGGVYVSEMPHLTFIKDTDGDGKADFREQLLTGFGTEDSHHSLHDFAWTPDGDLIFRESIFHHSQVETPYGPVRQQNSGWFRYEPRSHRLTSFGTYHSTNPWGVTFDDWGQHVASHPVYAAAHHSLDPPYPTQHPRPAGLQAYSGVCGHEFIDFNTFPEDLRGGFVKVRYKPTNRVELHEWIENDFGFNEQYVSDIIFSSNLSFIPVDLRYGPRGAMYVCDWYNPIKGHAQYSLRDERRDRHSGRIWRITAKDHKLQEPPKIAGASIPELLDILKRPEYRYRYWAKREIRERDPEDVKPALDEWVKKLSRTDSRFRHHQMEAVWTYRNIGAVNAKLLRELLNCENHHARAAATEQLRYWHSHMRDAIKLLAKSANDANGIVRMQAAIAASYIGTKEALDAMLATFNSPHDKHLAYAMTCALGSHTLRRHWENNPEYENVLRLLRKSRSKNVLKEPTPTAQEAQFDSQPDLKSVTISCQHERMRFTLTQVVALTGQPVKIVFKNPDATDHNLVIVKPGALEEVGMAANLMARDPKNANSDFLPEDKKELILHASPMIGPTRQSQVHVMRFIAPSEPGIYPYVCTFPGHWVIMKGDLIVADDLKNVEAMIAANQPKIIQEWKLDDFADVDFTKEIARNEQTRTHGMQSFVKAKCNQCHQVKGQGIKLGPDLTEVAKRFKGEKLLRQILEPSHEINKKSQGWTFLLTNGKVITGVIKQETVTEYHVITNLLLPNNITIIKKADVEEKVKSRLSSMPEGLVNILTKEEILNLVGFLESP